MTVEGLGSVVSVNVGEVREVTYHGRARTTGIYKSPVGGAVHIGLTGVAGDHQADLSVHGGPRKAVYAYALEDSQWWAEQLGTALDAGTFGENLTLHGLPVQDVLIGEQFRVGGALLEVTQPRFPCWKLGVRMGDSHFPRRFLEAGRSGTYFQVLEEGEVSAGDTVESVARPAHPITVGVVASLNRTDRPLAVTLLQALEGGWDDPRWGELLDRAGLD